MGAPGANGGGRILVVDDDPGLCASFRGLLQHAGYHVRTAGSGAEAVDAVAAEPTDLALLDLRLGAESGLDVLPRLKAVRPEMAVLMITAMGTIEDAVAAMSRGADNFVPKPIDPPRLLALVAKAVEAHALRQKNMRLERLSAAPSAPEIVTRSPAMRRALDLLESVAGRDTLVLLLGETGCGKGLLARRLHALSGRRRAPFVELNCAGLQRELTESELFGHERGAFTGAAERKIGLFEAAQGGTLFLDEIGEMDLGVQAKLLHVLEQKRFRRVGGVAEIGADVRVLAATHRDLSGNVERGTFRRDLFYRLNAFPLPIPPLRERREDIAALALRFLAEFRGTAGGTAEIAPEAMALLEDYAWPGNVRELRNAMERAAILCRAGEPVMPEHLPPLDPPPLVGLDPPPLVGLDPPPRPATADDPADVAGEAATTIGAAERKLVEQALAASGGNIVAAARRLGISRGRLYRSMRKFGIPFNGLDGE